ncbi:hypothetical protein [uncultured Aquimarina sp.]|uniref:hypothetical protein n=1 Tax=uncultured Aquimarina sp. TaxID=575652 RepID=UPI0004211FDC|nr:hypothetical protein [uncultured Aquimarina sp.]
MKKIKSLSEFKESRFALDTRQGRFIMGGGTHCVIITNCGEGENEDTEIDEQHCEPAEC